MIPLRFSVKTNILSPVIIRLNSTSHYASETQDYVLESKINETTYKGINGFIEFQDVVPSDIERDIFFVIPEKNIAHRLIRATSKHNTFLITEQCDQICVMCSQPPKKTHNDMFEAFYEATLLAPANMTIGLSGGEPTLHKKDLFHFLQKVWETRPDLSFHILSNGQHFTEDDIGNLQTLNRDKVVWGVPLYSSLPEIHDKIVGKIGAFKTLLSSFSILGKVGHQIELRTVAMKPNAPYLRHLSRFIIDKIPFIGHWAIMQLENIGYARMNWKELFYDNSIDFSEIGNAIDLVKSRGISCYLYNFPLCTIPQSYHSIAPSTISDWKRKYVEQCHKCPLRSQCGGLFEWHPQNLGYQNFGVA